MTTMDRPKSFFVFDRDGTGHPWERALRELAADPDEGRRAVAENWCMDHGVSLQREEEDLLGCGFIADFGAEEWLSSLLVYHRLRICQPFYTVGGPRPAYLESWNDSNLIRGVAPFDRLCRVASLQAIVRRVLAGSVVADVIAELFDKTGVLLPGKPPRETNPLWINREVDKFAKLLTDRGETVVRVAVRILLEALGPTEPPWWACFAEEVLPQIEAGSARGLCEAMGLGHFWAGEWLIVWIYPVADAGSLYRPTVAEAVRSPFYYPAPPEYSFGITMPLDPARGACRQVLHRPLRDLAAEAGCTGKLLLLEDFQPIDTTRFKELRRLHRAQLKLEFGTEAQRAWHDHHIGNGNTTVSPPPLLSESLAALTRADAPALGAYLQGQGLPALSSDAEPAEIILRAFGERS